MTNVPKISVCVPSYNHGKYIKETIDSILNQSFQDIEVIISDDNSDDDSVKVINSFNDSRITLIENSENSGPSINMNLAINKSQSDYIALIASDDIMHQDRLKKSIEFLESNKSHDAVFTYVQTINSESVEQDYSCMNVFNKRMDSESDILNYFFYEGNFLSAPSVLLKKSAFDKFEFNPGLWQLQDFDLWIKMLVNGSKIGVIPEKLTYYRIGNNLSCVMGGADNKTFSRACFETRKVLYNFSKFRNISDFLKVFPKVSEKYDVLDHKYIKFYLLQEALEVSKKKEVRVMRYVYREFATELAFELMMDSNIREKLSKSFNFTMQDYYNIYSENILINTQSSPRLKKIRRSIKRSIKKIFRFCFNLLGRSK